MKPQTLSQVTQAKNDSQMESHCFSSHFISKRWNNFFCPSTAAFLTKYNKNIKASNVRIVKAFSWVCGVLAFLLNLFIFSAQEITEKGKEAAEGRCSIREHRGDVKRDLEVSFQGVIPLTA